MEYLKTHHDHITNTLNKQTDVVIAQRYVPNVYLCHPKTSDLKVYFMGIST